MAALTLGNNLTGLVSSTVSVENERSTALGTSLTTGIDATLEPVDSFIGNSLKDNQIVLNAITQSTSYSVNLLNITDQYLNTLASTLQDALKTVASAGPLSDDKLAILQQSINNNQTQIDLIINTAKFDGKELLAGEASSIAVKVGLGANDAITVSVQDVSGGKLFRSSLAGALNTWAATGAAAGSTYYASQAEVDADLATNSNLVAMALANAGGSGTGGAAMTDAQLAAGIIAARTSNADIVGDLSKTLPLMTAAITASAAGTGTTWADTDATRLEDAITNGAGSARAELVAFLQDSVATDITTATGRDRSQDVFQTALNSVRSLQASLTNQKENVKSAAEALRVTSNVTEKSADSYLKTDYVETAQAFSESIKKMTASITTLQASNKVADAAQRLVDGLAR